MKFLHLNVVQWKGLKKTWKTFIIIRVRVRVRVSPREKILRSWCSRPERTRILNIHELACAYPCCNARQSLCFEDPVE
jgi:hypothetical protein